MGKRLPSERTPYHISDTTAKRTFDKEGVETFKAFGSDYSDRSSNIIYFSSIPLERTIAFKAFMESIKINLQKEVQKISQAHQDFQLINEKHTQLSYDITLNIPAHSTNEARNNVAKMEELQRLILSGEWKQTTTTPKTNKGVSNSTHVINPIFSVLFKNLISSGREYKGDYKNLKFKDIMRLGFPCYIEEVKYEPEQEMGYFKFDGYLFPKNIKLTLKLMYDSQALYKNLKDDSFVKNYALESFDPNGSLHSADKGNFPFYGVNIGNKKKGEYKEMNNIFTPGEKVDSYVFISLPFAESNGSPARYVLFKPFLTNFSRNVKIETSVSDGANQSIYNRLKEAGTKTSSPEFTVGLQMVAKNLKEAKANAGKIQILSRMFLKTRDPNQEDEGFEAEAIGADTHEDLDDPFAAGAIYTGGDTINFGDLGGLSEDKGRTIYVLEEPLSEAMYDSQTKSSPASALSVPTPFLIENVGIGDDRGLRNLMVYIPSMIERPKNPAIKSLIRSPKEMLNNSIDLFLEEFSFDIETDFGFFEENGRLFPKSYKVDLKFVDIDASLIHTYYLEGDAEDENVKILAKNNNINTLMDTSSGHLFPYNRKTVKIGG